MNPNLSITSIAYFPAGSNRRFLSVSTMMRGDPIFQTGYKRNFCLTLLYAKNIMAIQED